MKTQHNTYIKCTVEEDAPLYESFIYIDGANSDADNRVVSLSSYNKNDVEQIVNDLLINRCVKIKKVEKLSEPHYTIDLDATRTDDLPYIILKLKDIESFPHNEAG
ncbi:MAG: hypothetical protein K2H32_10010 [Muribaculaceae bacterium]|nr:hypothetical protein [Muribaculaceae bacterium]MDE5844041.1 hypothetical protein [Muribaculaceae bacterium]MDE5858670.1 hypothetical protein [Muribaculaceae bacterium]MDE7156243.1 hypothetical protein [Muribaculaceae bacterium]MDE7368934.1 hypothetical protein [Muribaculaceae bacterium]